MSILLYHAVLLVIAAFCLQEKVTTAKENEPYVYVITIPKDNKERACLKMQSTFLFSVDYKAKDGNDTINRTVDFTFEHIDFTYTGSCLQNENMVEFDFLNDWRLEFKFQHNNQSFSLYHITLYYDFDHPLFPNSIEHGAHSELYDGDIINGTLNHSYKCDNGLVIDLHGVRINLTNLHVEPFFNKPPNFPYSRDEVCFADEPLIPYKPVKIIIPIVIGCTALLGIITCIVVYVIKNKKSRRSDYDQVPTSN